MNFIRYEYIRQALTSTSFANVQQYASLSKLLSDYDIDDGEIYEYVRENQKIFAGESAKRKLEIKAADEYCRCPKCGDGVIIEPVNNLPGNQLDPVQNDGELYHSVASCRSLLECGWQKFSGLSDYNLMKSFFPNEISRGLLELDLMPHGYDNLET